MIPATIYPALHGYAPLAALVATRIYRDYAGDAPAAPYVVWSVLATVPSIHLAGRPPADRYSVSVDGFASTEAASDALLIAARDAMEALGNMSSGPQSLGYEPDANLWRWTFSCDVFLNR